MVLFYWLYNLVSFAQNYSSSGVLYLIQLKINVKY